MVIYSSNCLFRARENIFYFVVKFELTNSCFIWKTTDTAKTFGYPLTFKNQIHVRKRNQSTLVLLFSNFMPHSLRLWLCVGGYKLYGTDAQSTSYSNITIEQILDVRAGISLKRMWHPHLPQYARSNLLNYIRDVILLRSWNLVICEDWAVSSPAHLPTNNTGWDRFSIEKTRTVYS